MKVMESYLRAWTRKGTRAWMSRIEELIVLASKPHELDPECLTSDPVEWIHKLTKEVWEGTRGKLSAQSDENLMASRLVGLILVLWYSRVHRAKCHDPRRKPVDRRKGMLSLNKFRHMVFDCLTDESRDHTFFPDQEWDSPFPPTARYEPDDAELRRQRLERKIDRR